MKPYRHVEDTWAARRYKPAVGGRRSHMYQWDSDIDYYERMVEYIETGVEFSISTLWRAVEPRGPSTWGIANHVVKDLVTHRLIECIHKDKAGRCRRYRAIQTGPST